MRETLSLNERIIVLVSLFLVLLGGYFVLTQKATGITLLCRNTVFRSEEECTRLVELKDGVAVEQQFTMPYETFYSVTPLIECEEEVNGELHIELCDADGQVVFSKVMIPEYVQHIYKTAEADELIPVNEGGEYTLCIYVEGSDDSGILVKTDSHNEPCFSMRGGFTGRDSKIGFCVFYMLFCLLIISSVYLILKGEVSLDFDRMHLIDKILIGSLLLYCALFISEANDIQVIVRGSYFVIDSIREGKFFSYYDYAYERELIEGTFGNWSINYNIMMYIFVAIFVFPFRNLLPSYSFVYFIYVQSIIAALFVYCGVLCKKLIRDFGLDRSFEKTVPFLFMTSGMAIFCSVGFGQLDMVFIVIVLWALRFYAKKKYYRFSILMAFAIAFKTFPLLLFIPLILLANKKIKDIIAHLATGLSVTLLHSLIYSGSEGYKVMMKLLDDEQYFVEKLSMSRIDNGDLFNGMFGIALFIVAFVIICAFAYFKDVDADDKKSLYTYVALIGFLVYVDLFCFLIWHIAWLVPMALFMAMLIPLFPKTEKLMVMNLVLETAALLTAERWNGPNIDMLNYGLLTMIPNGDSSFYRGATFGSIHAALPRVVSDTYFALIVGVLLFLTVYFVRELPKVVESRNLKDPCTPVSRPFAWSRIGVVLAYSVFCLWCFYYIG